MNAEQHEWYWRGYNDAKESIQSGQLRVWFGLTDEEVLDMARTFGAQPWPPNSCAVLGKMIEAKLREKNT